MQTISAVGLDMGNQFAKVVVGPGDALTQRAMVLSVVLPTETGLPRGNEDLSKRETLRTLDVTITSKALTVAEDVGADLVDVTGRWIVGEALTTAAYAQQGQKAEAKEKKALNPKLYISGLTALALVAHQLMSPGENTLVIEHLTAGLPVDLCKGTRAYRREVARRLKGRHTIRCNNIAGIPDGRTITIEIQHVSVLPEGLGAALAQIYAVRQVIHLGHDTGHTLKLDKINPQLEAQNVLIFDIGGRTSDVVMLNPGLDYDDQVSRGLPYGVMSYLETIVAEVRKQLDDVTALESEGQLLQYLANWDGKAPIEIPFYGRMVDITEIVDRNFKILAGRVRDDLLAPISARTSAVFVVGGGAKIVQPYLEAALGDRYRNIVHVVADGGQWQNALGNLIYSITAQSEA